MASQKARRESFKKEVVRVFREGKKQRSRDSILDLATKRPLMSVMGVEWLGGRQGTGAEK